MRLEGVLLGASLLFLCYRGFGVCVETLTASPPRRILGRLPPIPTISSAVGGAREGRVFRWCPPRPPKPPILAGAVLIVFLSAVPPPTPCTGHPRMTGSGAVGLLTPRAAGIFCTPWLGPAPLPLHPGHPPLASLLATPWPPIFAGPWKDTFPFCIPAGWPGGDQPPLLKLQQLWPSFSGHPPGHPAQFLYFHGQPKLYFHYFETYGS